MADFRRVVTALAVVVLLMGFAQTVSAQPFTCTATAAVTPLLRSEGITELTGDIVLTCTGTPTAAAESQANIQVFFNAPVTSRLLSGSLSEAVLLIGRQPVVPGPAVEPVQPFVFPGSGVPTATVTAIQGIVAGNSVSFIGVPVIPEGTSRILRITNVRVNASAVPAGVAGVPGAVQALISVSGPTSLPIGNPQLTTGFVTSGLTFNLQQVSSGVASSSAVGASGLTFPQCVSLGRSTARAFLRFSENFPTAFKLRELATGQGVVGEIFNTESGLIITNAGGGTAGRADFGTRLRATFANVPAGMNIWVSVANLVNATTLANEASTSFARLILPETGVITTPVDIPVGATENVGIAQLTVVGGVATAVWEVRSTSPTAVENFDFQVNLTTSAAPATNVPAVGVQSTVAGSFFPVSTVGTASSTAPIPRFVDTSVPRNFAIFTICRTILLFPFVTNQAGFDTGLAISNTSQDPLGTAAQAGTCTWNFFGANAPPAVTTGSVAAGTTITTLASTTAPNFQGYAIAICNFQFAHGFAFVSDLGARNLAMGYLSLVIPDLARAGDERLDN